MKKRVITLGQVVEAAAATRPRRDLSADEVLVEKFAQQIEAGASVEPDAFVELVQHISHDSVLARVYHAYAIATYSVDHPIWHEIAKLARHGSDIREIAGDDRLLREAHHVRTGHVLTNLTFEQALAEYGQTIEPPEGRLKALFDLAIAAIRRHEKSTPCMI